MVTQPSKIKTMNDILLSKNAVVHLHSKTLDYLIRIQQKDDTLLKMT